MGVSVGLAVTLLAPSAASAAPVVSQGTGRLVQTSLLSSTVLDTVASLRGAAAVNADATGDVVVNTPLDATAVGELVQLRADASNLFGTNGIIQLGAVGQYGRAADDGSSAAFSGAVSQAASLIGTGTTVTGGDVGSPTAGSNAQVAVGTSTSPVSLNVALTGLAASAQQTADGTQTGRYTLTDGSVIVGGTVLAPTLNSLRGPLTTVLGVASGIGVNVANPIAADGTVRVTLQQLLTAAGVTSVNDLPANTNLLTYVPQAVTAQLTTSVNATLTELTTRAAALGLTGAVLNTALTTARGLLNPVLTGLGATLATNLSPVIDAALQLNVNRSSTSADGAFTQTALRVGVGPNASVAAVDLASATVGPNAGIAAVPVVNPASASIAGGGALVAAAIAALMVQRRRRAATAAV
ncbi:choice-of-anchor G family protein [Microbacterium sp. M1A1_1b]|uniref:PVV-CTERM domain-containing choice-of-anchor G protein n=1 Tax=Curtobacterium sp. VKM Ac-2922 TaxID=2929475 RepID=UPI001FB4D527|nr:choice-of-anchor G family protein [Curtobacterium sp. VKM Ac-2922]MCJ1713474.1 choice-of-anchor G family protein [Curtobacterium sp. VKM Ac-2922]